MTKAIKECQQDAMTEIHAKKMADIDTKLKKHASWLKDNNTGERADFSKVDYQLQEISWEGVNLSQAILIGVDFTRAKLEGANLAGADLTEATFYQAQMNRVVFTGATLNRTKFPETQIKHTDFSGSDITNCSWYACEARGVNFISSSISNCSFHRCWMSGSNFSKASLHDAEMTQCKLHDSNLSDSVLRNVNFYESYLARADLRGAKLKEGTIWSLVGYPNTMKIDSSIGSYLTNYLIDTLTGADLELFLKDPKKYGEAYDREN